MRYVLFLLLLGWTCAHAQDTTATSVQQLQQLLDSERASHDAQIRAIQQRLSRDSVAALRLQRQLDLLKEQGSRRQIELENQVRDIEARDSIRNAVRSQKILGLKEGNTGHPVVVFQDTLFTVYLKIGPILPAERAASIANKISLLYRDDLFVPDSIRIVDNDASVDVVYRDLIIMSVTEWDALWFDMEGTDLASEYAKRITTAIEDQRKARSFTNILTKVGLVVGIIFIVMLISLLIIRAFARFTRWLRTRKSTFFKGMKFRSYQFLTPSRELSLVIYFINLIKWVVLIFVLYISLPLIFSIFPFTQGWAAILFGWIWNPAKNIALAFVQFLPNLFYIAVIFLVIRYTVQLVKFLSTEVESERLKIPGFHPDFARPTFGIVRVLLYAFLFIAIFPYLPGSDSPIFRGVSVFLGILFSLGSSTAIANGVSGLVITYMRPFKVGDKVKIGEIVGKVIEKSVLVTRLKTIKNEYVTVPNAAVLTGHTVNYSTAKESGEGLVLQVSVTIGYDVPWRQVHELLLTAAEKCTNIDKEKEPFVLQTSLDDYYVAYQLNAITNVPEMAPRIQSELHQHIQDLFNEAGIEILSPHYQALRDGNLATNPSEYLPPNYVPPSFRIKKT